jgi:hypothetical protein
MRRVRVDFNARDKRGLIPVPLARLSSEAEINDIIEAYDGEEGFFGPASVAHIDTERSLAYIDVAWDQLRDPNPMPRVEAQGDFVVYDPHSGYLVIQVKSYIVQTFPWATTTPREKTKTHIASDVSQEDLLAS